MRQIKFRGKRVDNGEWVYGHYTEGSVRYHYITNPNGSVNKVDPSTVSQFTGLLDKNGKEIYEGDVVKNVSDKYVETDLQSAVNIFKKESKIDVVKYSGSCFSVFNNLLHRFPKIEVIGNIHDNPSLLTNK